MPNYDARRYDTYHPRPAFQDCSVADRLDDADSDHGNEDSNQHSNQSPNDMGCSTYSNSSRTTSSEDSPTLCSRMAKSNHPSHTSKAMSRYQMLHS